MEVEVWINKINTAKMYQHDLSIIFSLCSFRVWVRVWARVYATALHFLEFFQLVNLCNVQQGTADPNRLLFHFDTCPHMRLLPRPRPCPGPHLRRRRRWSQENYANFASHLRIECLGRTPASIWDNRQSWKGNYKAWDETAGSELLQFSSNLIGLYTKRFCSSRSSTSLESLKCHHKFRACAHIGMPIFGISPLSPGAAPVTTSSPPRRRLVVIFCYHFTIYHVQLSGWRLQAAYFGWGLFGRTISTFPPVGLSFTPPRKCGQVWMSN